MSQPNSSVYFPPEIEKAQLRGGGLGQIFKIASKIHKYGIYRIFAPFPIFNRMWGHVLGRFGLWYLEKPYPKLRRAFKVLFPHGTEKQYLSMAHIWVKFSAQILLDIIFHMPAANQKNLSRFIRYKDVFHLDNALAHKKGVLLASLHIGNLFYIATGLAFHPNKYEIVGIANLSNRKLFSELIKRNHLDNLKIVGTTNYTHLKELLKMHLKQNRIVVLMYDFTNNRQLRVPYWKDKLPVLKRTPQAILSLCRNTGAPIVPMIIAPDGSISRNVLRFLPPLDMASQEILSQKEFHGQFSLLLNNIVAPYYSAYALCNTQLTSFGSRDIEDHLDLQSCSTYHSILRQVLEKIEWELHNSYDPQVSENKIAKIKDQIENIRKELESLDDFSKQISKSVGNKLDLSGMSLEQEITILITFVLSELDLSNNPDIHSLIPKLRLISNIISNPG